MSRQNISSGGPWESVVGYSRAVRVGNSVFIAGTTATDASGAVVGRGDAYAQAVQIFKNIESALGLAGAGMRDVVRTRMFVTDIQNNWESVSKAHAEFLRDVKPAATMVEVSRLIDPDLLVSNSSIIFVLYASKNDINKSTH